MGNQVLAGAKKNEAEVRSENYRLEDLVDIPLLQNLQEKLNLIYSFPSAIIDNDGKILTAVAWQDICTKFHRMNPVCEKECIKSDQYILAHLHEANPAISYRCPHGLVDNATPIFIEGKHLGNFFTGQFFLEKPDLNFFRDQAKKYGFNEKEYLEAVEKTPVWSTEKLAQYLDFIKGFIEVIATIGLNQLREIESRRRIKEDEEKLKFYSDNSPMAVIEWDKDFSISRWTGESERFFGWMAGEVDGQNIFDLNLITDHDASQIRDTLEKLSEGTISHVIFKNRSNRKNGDIITCQWHITALKNQDGKLISALSQVLDITEQERVTEALKESELKYRSLIESSSDAIFCVDEKGQYQFTNQLFASTFGKTPDYFIGKSFWDIYDKEHADYRYEATKRLFQTGKSESIEVEVPLPDKTLYFLAATNPIKDENGKVVLNLTHAADITEIKNTQKELAESNQFNLQIINNVQEGIIVYDQNLHYRVWNPFMESITGIPASNVIGKKAEELFPFLSEAGVAESLRNALKGETMPAVDFPFNLPDSGKSGWTSDKNVPLRNAMGDIVGVIGTVHDISIRKIAEAALLKEKEQSRKNEDLLNRTGELAKVGGWEINLDSQTLTWTSELYEIHEVTLNFIPTVEEAVKFYDEQSRPIIERAVNDAINTGVPFDVELSIITNKNNKKEVRAIGDVRKDNRGKINSVFGAFLDISDRKRAERELIAANEKLKESTMRLNIAQAASGAGTWDWDIENNQFYWTEEFLDLFGMPKDTIAGFDAWKKSLHPDDLEDASKRIQDSIETKKELVNEYRIILPNNELRWIRSKGSTIYSDGKPVRMIGLCFDISQEKLNEQELMDAKQRAVESDQLKSAFLANMSHEIRTPMNGILGFAELLKEKDLTSDEKEQYIEMIDKGGVRLLNIINNIIDISKIEAGQMGVTISEAYISNQVQYVHGFLEPEAKKKGLRLTYNCSLPENFQVIRTDWEKVIAVLTNLVKNAIKFTDHGSIEIGCNVKSPGIEFFVKDTGIGLREEQKQIVFERFRQGNESLVRNFEGAGLGLSISKGFIELLGGKIWVESEYGEGSTFYFTLPDQGKGDLKSAQP